MNTQEELRQAMTELQNSTFIKAVSGSFRVFAGGLTTLERIPSSQQVDGLARNNHLTFAD